MVNKYDEKYNTIKSSYSHQYTEEGKKKRYRLLEVEICDKEYELTKFHKNSIYTIASFIISSIAIIFSLVEVIKDILGIGSIPYYIYLFLCLLGIFVLYISLFRESKRYERMERKAEEIRKEIVYLKIERLVLKDLLLEEDNMYKE